MMTLKPSERPIEPCTWYTNRTCTGANVRQIGVNYRCCHTIKATTLYRSLYCLKILFSSTMYRKCTGQLVIILQPQPKKEL